MRIGIAVDHGRFKLKAQLTAASKAAGYDVEDFGDNALAWKLVKIFLQAKFGGTERFQRRLTKVTESERKAKQ